MTQPDPAPDVNAFATIDLSGSGETPETGGQAFGRIAGGLAMLVLGIVIMIGSVVAFVVAIINPVLWDWAELIIDGAWLVGAIGLGLTVIGFTLTRSGRRQRIATLDAAMTMLDALPGGQEPETSKRILPNDAPGAQPPPKTLL